MFKKSISLFSITVILLATSLNTFATKPESETFVSPWDGESVGSCDGYDVMSSAVFTEKWTHFFDRDGVNIRSHLKGEEADFIFYNSEDPSIYVQSIASKTTNWSVWFYWQEINPVNELCDVCPGFRESGKFLKFKLPGYGWLTIDAGFHKWDPNNEPWWTEHGTGYFEDPDKLDVLCDALAH